MDDLDLAQARRIHIIGVGGTGLSGLARILLRMGKKLSGSDTTPSPTLSLLRRRGVRVTTRQSGDAVRPGLDLVVRSQAVLQDNPEWRKAGRLGVPVITYPEAVGLLMRKKRGIAVAGTHGKTTTSAMIVSILYGAGRCPSYVIGGSLIGRGNSGVGRSDLLVVEACEYRESFLAYRPWISVVTNVEEDHLDYYRDIRHIVEAFGRFCRCTRPDGAVVLSAEDARAREIRRTLDRRVVTFGIDRGDWTATDICLRGGLPSFVCLLGGRRRGTVRLGVPGRHNVSNALAATAVCAELGVSWKDIRQGLADFPGVRRRCEIRGCVRGIVVMDDYAHHPTEIRASLAAIRERFPLRRLIVVFQPHQYSRTRFLLKDFSASFSAADKVVVPDIYFVRDSIREKRMVNAGMLVDRIRQTGKEALYLPTFDEIVSYLEEVVRPGDMVVTMGAGPVNAVGDRFLRRMRKR